MSCGCSKKGYAKGASSLKWRGSSPLRCPSNASALCLAALFVLFAACGIEVYIYLEPVSTYINKPGSAADEALNYVAFVTSDIANYDSAEDYFKGFEIYYRIYNNITTLNSDVSAIDSYSEDTDTQALAYSYLISTKSYSRLTGSSRLTGYPLIEASDSASPANRAVYIRMYNAVSGSYTAGIKVYTLASSQSDSENGTLLYDYGSARRTISSVSRNQNKYTFQIDYITSSDSDVSWSTSSTSDGTLYVQFYVMAYGYDESFSNIYSIPYNLGYITLTEDFEDRGM